MRLFKECLHPHSPVIVEHKSEQLLSFKNHVALLSLPGLYTPRNHPNDARFLFVPEQVPDRLRIQRQPFALHIGLVWASGADNKICMLINYDFRAAYVSFDVGDQPVVIHSSGRF